MATVVQKKGQIGREDPSGPGIVRRRGRGDPAEVVVIRTDAGLRRTDGSPINPARAFAFPRRQAAPVRSTPRPPSSPAPLRSLRSGTRHHAA